MSYHHGNLRAALSDAGYELARVGGAEAITLRAAAREVGVSAPAAYRHFEDRDALVAAVAERCRAELAHRMAAARDMHTAPRRRFTATGRAYVQFALDEPGLIDCAFAPRPLLAGVGVVDAIDACAVSPLEPITEADPDGDALAVLEGVLDELLESGELSSTQRLGAELVAWSAVHGLALLLVGSESTDAEPAIDRVLRGVEDSLLGSE